MRRFAGVLCPAGLALFFALTARSADLPPQSVGISFSGTLSQDTDAREFFFTLTDPVSNVVLKTMSYAGGINVAGAMIPEGGFDPSLALFDSSGSLLATNQDGGCANVAADSVTGNCWDAWLPVTLPAGTYRAVITQSTNTANGPSLADSFSRFCSAADQALPASDPLSCTQTFTFDPQPETIAPGFWDQTPAKRTPAFALDVTGAPSAAALAVSAGLAPVGVQGQAYSFTLTIKSAGSYTWSVIAGSLPDGLVLNASTGVITGTPAASGTSIFTVQATDGVQTLTQAETLVVYSVPQVLSTSLQQGSVGQNYTGGVAITGGSGNFTISATGLPPGLSINSSTAAITGVVASAATVSGIYIVVTDNVSGARVTFGPFSLNFSSAGFSITSSGNLGEIPLGSNAAATLTAAGGVAPYTWSASGTPAGLTVNSSGAVGGVPLQPGNYSITVQVSDSEIPPVTVTQTFTLQVVGITNAERLKPGTTASVYSQAFSAAGGTGPYTFSSASLPRGLAFSGANLTGTPAMVGEYNFSVQVRDAAEVVASSEFSLAITGAYSGPVTVPGGALPGGVQDVAYLQGVSATDGYPGYTWKIIGGALPSGMSFDGSTGLISGTPPLYGTASFTAQATDSSGATASGVFTLTIAPIPLSLAGPPFPQGILGSDYPVQILTPTGGVPPYTFAIAAGSLPPGLSLSSGQISGSATATGTFPFTITLTDSASPATTVTAPTQIVIASATTANLILSSASLRYSLTTGATGVPPADSVTVQSSVVQQPLNYSVTATPAVSWLDVVGDGLTPGPISVSLDPSAVNLAASTSPLTTQIVVTCLNPSPCAGEAQSIQASLTVSAPSPQLIFNTSLVTFSAASSGTSAIAQLVAIQNVGSGSATNLSASAADSWLTVSGLPESVASGTPVNIIFTANPAGLSGNFYRTTVTIVSSSGTITLPVTLSIGAALTLSPSGAQYISHLGSAPGITSGSFALDATNGATVNWSATVLPGSPWLRLAGNSTSGSASAGSPATVGYTIDPVAAAALSPAQPYYGTIQVTASGTSNSPQNFLVVLNVVSSAVLPIPAPSPAGLTFQSSLGAAAPATQIVNVFTGSPTAVTYAASGSTGDGNAWITVSPALGTASASSPGVTTVSVNPGTLPAGTYYGTVSYQFSAAAVRTVNVTMIISANGTVSSSGRISASGIAPASGGACTSSQLVPTQTGLVNNFAQAAAWPTPFSISVMDNCGTAVANGQVITTFSNGDPPLALQLVNASTGLYSGTWTPRATSSQVSVTATVTAPGFANSAITRITGEVVANGAPLLAPNGVLHIYNPQVGAAIGQGTILQIYGSNLSGPPAGATTTPLKSSLGGTSVIIGGYPAALYYVSANQIDAQLPFELTPGNNYQVVVSAGGALSTPATVQLSAATPGIAAFPSGLIVAQHSSDSSLISESSPAAPGEYIVMYLSGVGAVTSPVADGVVTPLDPLSYATITPTLTLNGVSIPIYFTGLTPGDVGLYQIDVQVPQNTPNGDASLVVSQNGSPSNVTILPVHN